MRGKSGIRGVCLPYDLTVELEFSVKWFAERQRRKPHERAGRKEMLERREQG